jgi:hypothetical protein
MIFQTGVSTVDVKPVSLIFKMLQKATASYRGSHKILQRQTFLWDCPFNTRNSKRFNLVSNAQENMIRVYYTLKLSSFCSFYWTIGDFTADRLSTPNFRKSIPKPYDKIS